MSVQWKRPDGSFSTNPVDAHRVSPFDVVVAWRKVSAEIPARFAVGTAYHETRYTVNERDPHDQGDKSDSDGIFQLSSAEKILAVQPGANLFDLDDASRVFSILMHRNKAKLENLGVGQPDLWAWLTVTHNQGYGAAEKSIKTYGPSWEGYRNRNRQIVKPGFNGPAIVAYGDDAISGGPGWDSSWDALPDPDPSEVEDGDAGPLVLVGGLVLAGWALGRLLS